MKGPPYYPRWYHSLRPRCDPKKFYKKGERKKKKERLTRNHNRLKIEDNSHTVSSPCLAWACIRLDRLQRGYRFIRLFDMKGNEIPGGKLLVKVEKVLR